MSRDSTSSKLYQQSQPFTQIPNQILSQMIQTKDYRSLTLYTYMRSQPPGFRFKVKWLASHFGCSETTIKRSILVLIEHGWLQRIPRRKKNGQKDGFDYQIMWNPIVSASSSPVRWISIPVEWMELFQDSITADNLNYAMQLVEDDEYMYLEKLYVQFNNLFIQLIKDAYYSMENKAISNPEAYAKKVLKDKIAKYRRSYPITVKEQ